MIVIGIKSDQTVMIPKRNKNSIIAETTQAAAIPRKIIKMGSFFPAKKLASKAPPMSPIIGIKFNKPYSSGFNLI